METVRFFNIDEFASPDSPGSGISMQSSTLAMLESARRIAGIPFVVTSGFRTMAHNRSIGGVPNSAHTRGYAADIAYSREATAVRIIAALTQAGFRRIGKGKSFVHADNDPALPVAYWDYSQADHVA